MRYLLLLLLVPAVLAQEEGGYFLSSSQKAQLIWEGTVEDAAGQLYDVRIVPGYVDPSQRLKRGWRNGARELSLYGDSATYVDLAEDSEDCIRWGLEDCIKEFALEGSRDSWSDNFKSAKSRVDNRVIGWWMAYPWAAMRASVSTVCRLPIGAVGGVLGVGSGVVAVPAWHMIAPAGSAVCDIGIDGLILPVGAGAWNTVVAPPLALLGQKPSPERVDHFWITPVNAEDIAASRLRDEPLSAAELDAILAWAKQVEGPLAEFAEDQAEINKVEAAERRKLQQQHSNARKARQQAFEDSLPAANLPGTVNRQRLNEQHEQVRAYLRKHKVDSSQIHQLLRRLREKAPTHTAVPEKTDPVKESVDIIENLD